MSVILCVIGYLLGSIPFAFLVAVRWGGTDVRRSGSGNVGAANVARTTRTSLAVLAAVLDAAKGSAAVLIAHRFGSDGLTPTASGVAAVVGHVYPVWLGLRGGKGVATTGGAFALLAPLATSLAVTAFAVTTWVTRYVSLGSVVAAALLAPLAYLTGAPAPTVLGAVMVGALVLLRHRSNVGRLLRGTETRLGHRPWSPRWPGESGG